jgi:hypothetical protein
VSWETLALALKQALYRQVLAHSHHYQQPYTVCGSVNWERRMKNLPSRCYWMETRDLESSVAWGSRVKNKKSKITFLWYPEFSEKRFTVRILWRSWASVMIERFLLIPVFLLIFFPDWVSCWFFFTFGFVQLWGLLIYWVDHACYCYISCRFIISPFELWAVSALENSTLVSGILRVHSWGPSRLCESHHPSLLLSHVH